jgi:exodeoxyribonuclease VII small subunit
MAKTARRMRFEDALARLEQIVAAMESGQTGIEESITQYEEAMRLAAHCRQVLDQAEQRIRQIRENADGSAELTEFELPDDVAGAEESGERGAG